MGKTSSKILEQKHCSVPPEGSTSAFMGLLWPTLYGRKLFKGLTPLDFNFALKPGNFLVRKYPCVTAIGANVTLFILLLQIKLLAKHLSSGKANLRFQMTFPVFFIMEGIPVTSPCGHSQLFWMTQLLTKLSGFSLFWWTYSRLL